MAEPDVITRTPAPVTTASLTGDLRALGVASGDLLLVHSSLRALGWVCGGPQAVVAALAEAVGPGGTLVVPAFSTGRSEPSYWKNPPVPEAWWPVIRDELPAFDPALTPTRNMGLVVDCLRCHPQAVRSSHPTLSFAALGPLAERIVSGHALAFGDGEDSPLARVYDLDGKVLLLGVPHENNTSLHLAQHRAGLRPDCVLEQGSAVLVDGERRWVTFPSNDEDTDYFDELGEDFSATGAQTSGPAGCATALLMSQRALVDFAVEWIRRHRR